MNLFEVGAWTLLAAFVMLVIIRTIVCALFDEDED